jgi:excisionase family DNA binding protein
VFLAVLTWTILRHPQPFTAALAKGKAMNQVTTSTDMGSTKPLAVSVQDACKILSIGPTKMWELIGDGRVRTLRIGRKRLVTYASLEALLEAEAV